MVLKVAIVNRTKVLFPALAVSCAAARPWLLICNLSSVSELLRHVENSRIFHPPSP